jgi:hypothetical protein
VTGCLIEEWGFDSVYGRKHFIFYIASRLPLWPTQPPVQSVLWPVSLFIMSPPPGATVKYVSNHNSYPIHFHVVVLSEALGTSFYFSTVLVLMSNCTVLGSLEPHHCCTTPSAYNLLHRNIDTGFLQLIV